MVPNTVVAHAGGIQLHLPAVATRRSYAHAVGEVASALGTDGHGAEMSAVGFLLMLLESPVFRDPDGAARALLCQTARLSTQLMTK